MEFNMSYGCGRLPFKLDSSKVIEVLEPQEIEALLDPVEAVKFSIAHPIGTLPLSDLLRKKNPEKVVIIVNDITRPTPYETFLPPLLDVLQSSGIKKDQITFITATGIHAPHTEKQNREVYGDYIVDNFSVISHDADDSDNLVYMGKLFSGTEFYLNRLVFDADFVITLGVITPHYFAGFSGGRKSILPGVAGRKTIELNHSKMVDLMDDLPPLRENPINLEMIEASRLAQVDFILNVVPNSKMEPVKVVAGDVEKAWHVGVELSSKMFEVPLKEKADIVIVSAGGHPRDLNIYQVQKALDHADRAVKEGGTIIVVAECSNGLGEPIFEEWMNSASSPNEIIGRIKKEFVLGGHKAFGISKVAIKNSIVLISKLSEEQTNHLFMKKIESIDETIRMLEEECSGNLKYILMPSGSLTVPVYNL